MNVFDILNFSETRVLFRFAIWPVLCDSVENSFEILPIFRSNQNWFLIKIENSILNFSCECNTGFTGNGEECVDVDECLMGTHTCDPNAECTNTVGSFKCKCGTRLNGFKVSWKTFLIHMQLQICYLCLYICYIFLYRCLSLRRISFTLAYNFAKKATSFQPPKMCHLAYTSLGKMRELAELISLPNTALGQILHLQKCVTRSNKALSQMLQLAK